jgi:hypothetical protein
VWETEDAAAAFRAFGDSTTPHADWFRKTISEIHGFSADDFADAPEVLLGGSWIDPGYKFGEYENSGAFFPIKPGTEDKMIAFAKELTDGKWTADYAARNAEVGLKRQAFFLQTTPQGKLAIMYGEGKSGWLDRGFDLYMNGTDELSKWWRDTLRTSAAVPLFEEGAGAPPQPELILELTVRTPVGV